MEKIKKELYNKIKINSEKIKVLKRNNGLHKRSKGNTLLRQIIKKKYGIFIQIFKGKRKQSFWILLTLLTNKAFLEGQRQMYEKLNPDEKA